MTENVKAPKEKREAALPVSLYRMEIDVSRGGVSAVVTGVIGIVEMSEALIKIMTKIGSVTVMGTKLNIAVFEYKTLQISGKIENISFAKTDNTREKRSGALG